MSYTCLKVKVKMKVLSGEDTSCHVNDVNHLMSHGSWETLNTLRSLVSGRAISAERSTVAGATSRAGGSREAAGTSKAGETWGAWGSIVADAALGPNGANGAWPQGVPRGGQPHLQGMYGHQNSGGFLPHWDPNAAAYQYVAPGWEHHHHQPQGGAQLYHQFELAIQNAGKHICTR